MYILSEMRVKVCKIQAYIQSEGHSPSMKSLLLHPLRYQKAFSVFCDARDDAMTDWINEHFNTVVNTLKTGNHEKISVLALRCGAGGTVLSKKKDFISGCVAISYIIQG